MATKSKFKYRGDQRTVEDVSRRAKHSSGLYDSLFLDGFAVFKPKEGENQIRILPFTWEDVDKWGTSWEIMIFTHNNIGPDKGSFLCLNHMKDESCPICEARRVAVDDEERSALRPGERALVWLIDRNDEKAGPMLWSMPIKTVFKVINARSTNKKTGALLLIDDPEEGYDLFFTREGTGIKTDYVGVELDRDPTPLHDKEPIQNKWLDYIQENPLPTVLNIPEAEYIEKVLSGRVARKSEDEEEESPRRSSRRSRSEPEEEEEETTTRRTTRRRPSEEAAEEEEELDAKTSRRTGRSRSEPEEEEETERPSGRRTGSRSSPEPEEEVEEKPAGRRRASKEPEEEEHDPETGELSRRITRRRSEPEEEEEPPPESKRARAGLEKLRNKRK